VHGVGRAADLGRDGANGQALQSKFTDSGALTLRGGEPPPLPPVKARRPAEQHSRVPRHPRTAPTTATALPPYRPGASATAVQHGSLTPPLWPTPDSWSDAGRSSWVRLPEPWRTRLRPRPNRPALRDRRRLRRVLGRRAKYHVTPAALARRLVVEGLDREADTESRIAEARDELGVGADQKMIVMTREQFLAFTSEIARYTTTEVIPKMMAEAVEGLRDELRKSTQPGP
jgi:hypothetical protein